MSVDKSEQRIRRMFGEVSPRYDLLDHLLSGGVDFYWRWRTVRQVSPNGPAPILDVCSGTGDLAISYWKRGRRRIPVLGTDFTHAMLVRAARKALKHCNQPNTSEAPISFLGADTQRLPFAEDQFQIVSVAFGLRNVTNTESGLSEMVRVCRPGGRVVVLEFSLPTNRLLRAVYQWYFRNILPRIGGWLAWNKESAYDYLPESVSQFPQGSELADLMQTCGLSQVTWQPLTFGVATLYCGVKLVE